jgi:release factor glutamine methyltransferase
MTSIADALKLAATRLSGYSGSPRLDAEVLLGHVLGLGRAALVAADTTGLCDERAAAFDGLVRRRLAGAPVAYLTGRREFWSLDLCVSPAVLVPRPETETLVALALERLAPRGAAAVLDLGTGSGAIALAIAGERPEARVTGSDVSAAALEVAAANGRRLSLGNVRWRLGSWFDAVPGERFDLIVANPPYVAAGDPALAALAAEPALALTPGPGGLEAFAAIAAAAGAHLRGAATILLEHGADQGPAVAGLLETHGFRQIHTHHDDAGAPRVTLATLPTAN